MKTTFLRTLLITAILQFFVTRMLAGRAIEEGRAERLWLMFPLNVLVNAAAWTLLIAGAARVGRVFRPRPS